MKILSQNLAQTAEVAQHLLATFKKGERALVIALQGDLGAGKTAFSQALGQCLGVVENMHSPTFVIMKVYGIDYRGFKNLIHIDAYRLEKPARPDDSGHSGGESELLHLGWEELVREPENLILIEWPENVPGVIPKNAKKISFKFVDENVRDIEIYES